MPIPAPNGLDAFATPPHQEATIACRVCGATCDVTRDIDPVPSYVRGLMNLNRPHDYFLCPHGEEDWHRAAHRLAAEMRGTASRRVADLIRLDLEEFLEANRPK